MSNVTPEEMQKGMEPWMAWAARCGSALIDMGAPLVHGQTLTRGGSAPSSLQVAGYSILEAADMDAAKALLEGHPHLEWIDGAEIEVQESAPMAM